MEQNQKRYIVYLEGIRWNGEPKCPYCDSRNSSKLKEGIRHHCNTCFTSYSVTVGTIFHKTHVDLQKWFTAISLILKSPKKISIRVLAQEIGVTKKTAALMIKKIQSAKDQDLKLIEAVLLISDFADEDYDSSDTN